MWGFCSIHTNASLSVSVSEADDSVDSLNLSADGDSDDYEEDEDEAVRGDDSVDGSSPTLSDYTEPGSGSVTSVRSGQFPGMRIVYRLSFIP